MLSYFLPTLYGSLSFPFFSQNTNLPKYQVANAVSANIECLKPAVMIWAAVTQGSCLALVPVCKFVPTRYWCLGMVSQSWMSTWMTKLQENVLQRENKGISCPCVEHLDLWNREEKPFSILYMIKKDSPSWKAAQIFWCHPLNSEQWVVHSSWVLISLELSLWLIQPLFSSSGVLPLERTIT